MIKRFIYNANAYSKKIYLNDSIIESSAFADSMDFDFIAFDNKIKQIKQNAFENCSELQVVDFYCETVEKNQSQSKYRCIVLIRENNKIINEKLYIQFESFKNCKKLHSLLLPVNKPVIIEKNAFFGCDQLRTVVAINGNIQINEGAFSGCSSDLTFICIENSHVDIYAREHGYKIINVSNDDCIIYDRYNKELVTN